MEKVLRIIFSLKVFRKQCIIFLRLYQLMYFSLYPAEGPSLLMCELETLKFDIDNKCFRLRVRVTVSINVKIKEAESLVL